LIYYRHISLLNISAQILENTLHKRLSQNLHIENTLVAEQFGFKKEISTENAMQKTADSLLIYLKHHHNHHHTKNNFMLEEFSAIWIKLLTV
jgi:hypothetical protein